MKYCLTHNNTELIACNCILSYHLHLNILSLNWVNILLYLLFSAL